MVKIFFKWTAVVVVFFVFSSMAGIIAERFIMPWLSSKESLQHFSFFQKANEKVTVINKTEQVLVKEDYTVSKTAQNVLPGVVSIISYQEKQDEKTTNKIITSQDIQRYAKTGLILASDGLIISLATKDEQGLMLEDLIKRKYKVLLSDGREAEALPVAYDTFTNAIFYKIELTNLPVPALGNSDELEAGEKIIISGNASGEYSTNFSMGVIQQKDDTFSILNSELSSSEKMEGAFTTDAQINFKNIGGPVIDFNGTVVGIAGQIEKDAQTVNYIIPINLIKESIDKFIRDKNIQRPKLGVYYLSINREIALLNQLSINQGALVYSFSSQQGLAVLKGAAADRAGLKLGDVITKINDQLITGKTPLSLLISRYQKGQTITLLVLRGKEELTLKATLE